jgi:peptidyl-prolyl cis-trans isomerase B (cyclophilin B)
MGRPESRSAHRAAKRAATGRPPAGTPGRPRKSQGTNWAVIGLAGAAALVGTAVIVFGNPFGTPTPSGSAAASGAASPAAYGDGTCPTSQPASLAADEKRTVTIETELGNIVIEVDGSRAPIATGNFVALVECEYYDGIGFHRLVPGFVIQGGDPDGTGSGPGPGYSIEDDPLVGSYRRGTVAMARTPNPDSQGSQFFIVLSDDADEGLKQAQYPYAILGEVTSGMEVVDAIAAMPNSGGQANAALDPVVMTLVTVSTGTAPSASPAASAAPSASAAPTSPATSP